MKKIFEEPVIECVNIVSENITTGGGLLEPSMGLTPDEDE